MEDNNPAYVSPVIVEPEFLNEEEIKFYTEKAGEINFMLNLAGNGSSVELAEFSIYFFHLGREFEKGQE